MFIGTYIGFFANTQLFRFIEPGKSYLLSITLLYLFSFLFFLKGSTVYSIFCMGLLIGLIYGAYWACRHSLVMRFTLQKERGFFSSIDMAINLISSVILPFIYGFWIDGAINYFHLDSVKGYLSVYLLILPFAALLFLYSLRGNFNKKEPVRLKQPQPSRSWKIYRTTLLLSGIPTFSTFFFTPLLVLKYLGEEFELGLYQSIFAVATAVLLIHLASKKPDDKQLINLFLKAVIPPFIISVIFYFYPNGFTSVMFLLSLAFLNKIYWNCSNVLGYSIASKISDDEGSRLMCLLDREMYLSYGRFLGFIIICCFLNNSVFGMMMLITVLQLLSALIFHYFKDQILEDA